MDSMEKRILRDGSVLPGNIVKIGSFVNHRIDPVFNRQLAQEFARRFADSGVTVVLTLEASGIALAVMTAEELGAQMVFAKKNKTMSLAEELYVSHVLSYTTDVSVDIVASKDYIKQCDTVLIIDDVLARGEAALGLCDIVEQSGARLAGCGFALEKEFQGGGALLRERDIRVESLAVIEEMDDSGNIRFKP